MSARSATPAEAEPIPISVLTGFLGAGKTSLLNRLIGDPALAETAVIINEFGEIGLLVNPEQQGPLQDLRGRIHALNPAAPVLDAGTVDPATLIECGLFDPSRKIPDVRRWLNAETYASHAHDHPQEHDPNRHDERIRAFVLTADAPIATAAFEMFIDLLRSLHGPKLLRLKGIVQIAEGAEQPLVIHGVQHVMHPPVRLDGWPDDDRRTRIVLITRDLSAGKVEPLFRAFLNHAAPDQADRAALLDNPLVPFGGRDR